MDKQAIENSDVLVRGGNRWQQGLLVLFLVAVILFFILPLFLGRGSRRADMTETVSNAKQVYLLMVEIDQEFGEFPGDATAVLHKGVNGEPDLDLRPYKGQYSNDYFGQFIAAGYTKSEEIFYAKGSKGKFKKPDNQIGSVEQILEAGECGFAYVKGQSTSDQSGRPILMAPMSGRGLTFDRKVYDGKGIVLRIDGSVKQHRLNKSGEAIIKEGETLFDSGLGTVWEKGGFNRSWVVLPEMLK